jgi:DNA mismatch repair protein MutS
MALIKEYFELTEKYQNDYGINTILLMQVGSFYEVYGIYDKQNNSVTGSQINNFSRICDLNISEKNVCVGSNNVVMAGFKDIMIDKYIKKILESDVTAVVYSQELRPDNTITRNLTGIFSPGTYFNNDTQRLTNNTTCIWIDLIESNIVFKGKHVVVGVSNIDIYTGKTSIFQFKELYINNPTTYDELERFISIYNPSEVIIISNLPEQEVDDVINYANIQCTLIHKINFVQKIKTLSKYLQQAINCEKQIYQKEILDRFYKIDNFDLFNDNVIATQSFCFLLDFIYQHNPYLVNKIKIPIFENCSERLILANHSLKQLNMIDDHNYTGKYSSVLKMLNCCLTPMGKRKFAYNFLNPTTNCEYLQKEYDMIDYLLSNFNPNILIKLQEIKDISKFERQIFLKKITPKSIYILYKNINLIKEVHHLIQNDTVIMNYLNYYENDTLNISTFCDNITNFIKNSFIIELAQDIEQLQGFEINFIQKNINFDLDNKTKSLIESNQQLESVRSYLNSLIESGEKKSKTKTCDYIKIHETEKNNFSLICTDRRCQILKENIPSGSKIPMLTYISSYNNQPAEFQFNLSKKDIQFNKQSASNNIISNIQITALCKNISNLKVSMKDTITIVFNDLINQFELYQKQIEVINNFITIIDVIFAKTTLSKKYNYCKPTIINNRDKSFVDAENIRHPLIEQLHQHEIYVSNNIILGNSIIDGILLYGTNAVGKTSLIKSIGINIIMAQSGLYVPCSKFSYKPYKYIFTRIIGNDNIFKGLSTFAVEMSELRTILNIANKDSLILGDELCSGTEISSAISIFVAGIQKLNKLKSSFIFATHLHEIVKYDEIIELTNV